MGAGRCRHKAAQRGTEVSGHGRGSCTRYGHEQEPRVSHAALLQSLQRPRDSNFTQTQDGKVNRLAKAQYEALVDIAAPLLSAP